MVYMFVGIAGSLGAILRYLIGIFLFSHSFFPYATLCINLVGSFLLAWLTTRFFRRTSLSPLITTAIGTGFVGSFTTFSTLSVETVQLFQRGAVGLGVLYVTISIIGGFLMSTLGFNVEREVQ